MWSPQLTLAMFRAIEERFVSITPLQIDLTNRDEMPPIAAWIER